MPIAGRIQASFPAGGQIAQAKACATTSRARKLEEVRYFAIIILVLTGWTSIAFAQRSHAYWVASPGGLTAGGHTQFRFAMAGGGEIKIARGFAAGAEIGVNGPRAFNHQVVGLLSVNGFYHPLHAERTRLDPFVTAGYSLLFRSQTRNLFNYGGGVNYWFVPHLALRGEVRDHIYDAGGRVHLWELRMGVSFSTFSP